MVQTERLVQTFCRMVSFDSPSYGEREICDFLTEHLTALGLRVQEDAAAQRIHGTAGNLYAYLPATQGMEPAAAAVVFRPYGHGRAIQGQKSNCSCRWNHHLGRQHSIGCG